MIIKIDGATIPRNPSEFSVDVMDLDDGSTTTRTVDGTLHRDRIAVKRKINMRWNALTWDVLSQLLEAVSPFSSRYITPTP